MCSVKSPLDVTSAVELWIAPLENAQIKTSRWFEELVKHWLHGPCTILEDARFRLGNLDKRNRSLLEKIIRSKQQLLQRASLYVDSLGVADAPNLDPNSDAIQLVNLVVGVTHAVLAASHWQAWSNCDDPSQLKNQPFLKHAAASIQCIHEAWPLSFEDASLASQALQRAVTTAPTSVGLDKLGSLIDGRCRVAAVTTLRKKMNGGGRPWSSTSWLIFRRLLSFILNEAPHDSQFSVKSQIPCVYGHLGETHAELIPFHVELAFEGQSGFYIDPIESGLLLLDRSLCHSLRLAWRLCQQDARELKLAQRLAETTFRIAVKPNHVRKLTGRSAGGLFAVAMHAANIREPLDSNSTASFAIALTDRSADDDRSPLTVDQIRLEPVAPDSVDVKVRQAAVQSVERIVLHEDQQNSAYPAAQHLGEWSANCPMPIRIASIRDFRGACQALLGHAKFETVLRAYCHQQVEIWQQLCQPGKDEMTLEQYVAPRFLAREFQTSNELPDSRGDYVDPYQPLCAASASEDVKFQLLFNLSERIIIHEDGGAGKSVFTRRVVAWLSQQATWSRLSFLHGKPCLAIRWAHNHEPWPYLTDQLIDAFKAYRQKLEEAVQVICAKYDMAASELIDYALKMGRVVFVLDGFDQLHGVHQRSQRSALSTVLNQCKEKGLSVRVIVTSRASAIDGRRSAEELFSRHTWKPVRIGCFTPHQQLLYLQDLVAACSQACKLAIDSWLSIAGSSELTDAKRESELEEAAARILRRPEAFGELYDQCSELLQIPLILRFVHERGRQLGRIPRFAHRADLYFQATYYVLDRNLSELAKINPKVDDRIEAYREACYALLPAIAFQMMSEANNHWIREEISIDRLKVSARARISEKLLNDDWDDLWKLVTDLAGVSKYLSTDEKSHDYFGWKQCSVMEFYCGLFLCKNSQPNWILKTAGSPALWHYGESNLPRFAADPRWYWAFRFAIELPVATDQNTKKYVDPDVWATSLNALYVHNGEVSRPCRLMLHAWPYYLVAAGALSRHDCETLCRTESFVIDRQATALLQQRVAAAVDSACEQFDASASGQTSAAEPVAGPNHSKPKLSRSESEAMPLTLWQTVFDQWSEMNRGQQTSILESGLVRFLGEHRMVLHQAKEKKNAACMAVFEKGFRRIDFKGEANRPGNQFMLHEFPLTNDVHALFDPCYSQTFADYAEFSPHSRCPVIFLDWYGAWCVALWAGGCLPHDAEWEHGCKGKQAESAQHDWCHGNDETALGEYAWYYDNSEGRTWLVDEGQKRPNDNLLFHVHGSVWEWTANSILRETEVAQSPKNAPRLEIVCGGAFDSKAADCKASFKGKWPPHERKKSTGVRIARWVMVDSEVDSRTDSADSA